MKKRIVVVLALLGNACCGAIANMDYFQKKEDIEEIINVRGFLGIGYNIGNLNRDLRIALYNQLQESNNNHSNKITVDNVNFESEFKDFYDFDLIQGASFITIKALKTNENINTYFNAIENFYLSGEKNQPNPEDVYKKLTTTTSKKFNYLALTKDAQAAVDKAKDNKYKALYTYLYNRLITYRAEDLEEEELPQKLDTSTFKDDDVAKNTGINNITTLVSTTKIKNLKTVDNIIKYFDAIEDFYLNNNKKNDPTSLLNELIESEKKLQNVNDIKDINKYIQDISNDYHRSDKLRDNEKLKQLGLDYVTVLNPLYNTTNDYSNVNSYLEAASKLLSLEKNDSLKEEEKTTQKGLILSDLTSKLKITEKDKNNKIVKILLDEELQKNILKDDNNIITKLLKSVPNEKKERMAIELVSKNLDEFALLLDPNNKTLTERKKEKETKEKRQELENKLNIKPFIIFNFLEKDATSAKNDLPKAISQTGKDLITYLYNTLQENCYTLQLSDCTYKKIELLNDTAFITIFNKQYFVDIVDLVSENILKALKNANSSKLEDQVAINDYLNGIYQLFINTNSEASVVDDLFKLLGNATLKNNANQLTSPEGLIGYCIKKAAELPDTNMIHTEMQMLLEKHKTDLSAYLKQFEELVQKTNDNDKKKREEEVRKKKEEEERRKKADALIKNAAAIDIFGNAISDIK